MEPQTPTPEEESPLKQIRTFQGDVAETLAKKKSSLISLRTAAKAKQKETPNTSDLSAHSRLRTIALLLLCIVLLAGAGVGGWYAHTSYQQKISVAPAVVIPDNRFLPVTHTHDADTTSLDRDALVSLAASERSAPLAPGNISQIELWKQTASSTGAIPTLLNTTEFMLVLRAQPSSSLVRAFDPLFMLGTVGVPNAASSTENSTFLLIKLDSYENAYAGQLDWEKNMRSDLIPLFHDASVLDTIPADASFVDRTLDNKDARELLDTDGKSVLVYSFYNQQLLIITGNEEALGSIINALDTEKLSR